MFTLKNLRKLTSDGPAISEPIVHKIHTPTFIGRSGPRERYASFADALLLRFQPQTQAFLVIKSIHPLEVDLPAFAPQQSVEAFVTVTHAGRSQVFQTHTQFRLWISPVAIVIDRAL